MALWSFRCPNKRWVTGPFDAQKNEVLTEVLEFSYATVTRMPLTEAAAMIPAVSALIRP